MNGSGKKIRWSRFVSRETQRGIIIPLDHGFTYGPIAGLESIRQIATWIHHPAINGVIGHKGLIARMGDAGLLNGIGVMIHLNGMTSISEAPDTKRMMTTVKSAVRLGADAVSVQVNFTEDNHTHNLMLLGSVVDEAHAYGLPVLAMVYDCNPPKKDLDRLTKLRHLLRSAYELGVDAVKTEAPENLNDIPILLNGISEDVAVFLAGGALGTDERLLSLAGAVIGARGAGLCVGRNVFQHTKPADILNRLSTIFASG